jgi:CRISPR/Cas system-associated exonuclease Cas4 (RecB family)
MERMVRVENNYSKLPLDNIQDPVGLTKALLKTSGAIRESGYKYPRSSQMGDICPREWVFGMNSEVKRSEFIYFSLLMVFRLGSAIHKYFQNTKSLFPDIMGHWKCLACNNEWRFCQRPQGVCPKCGALNRAIQYKEHYFSISDPFYATGKIDLFHPVGNPVRYRIGDIKGVTDDSVEPRGTDIFQLATYLVCAKYDDSLPENVDTNIGYLFYISKKMSFKSPVRTIKVELTPALEEAIMVPLMQIKRGVDEGLIPPKLKNCKNKNCPFKVECLEHGDRNDFPNL